MDENERRKYIEEIFRYCRTDSFMVINERNQLEELACPFAVVTIRPVGEFHKGAICIVSEIKMDLNLLDVYIIRNKAYYYFNFKLVEL
jgi:hypothetical protein